MNKITDILKDEESLRQLSELAQMLKSGEFDEQPKEEVKQPENTGDMLDAEMMMKLMSLAGTMNENDKNTQLLLALRPHLSEPAQLRLDRAVKLLKIIMVYETAKESGLINL